MNLDEAKTLISQWRQSKRHASEKMPEHLWNMACTLAQEHTVQIVAKELSITSAELKRRLRRAEQAARTVPKVEVRPFSTEKKDVRQDFLAEIAVHPNMVIRIPSSISEQNLKLLFRVAREYP